MTSRFYDTIHLTVSRTAHRLALIADAVHNWLDRNWFRLLLLSLLTWVLLQKDLSVQVNLGEVKPLPGALNLKAVATDETHPDGEEGGKAAPLSFSPGTDDQQAAYVRRFSKVAVQEMKRFGIPASITLAQGILETKAGTSPLATRNNNHFGIKCFSKACSRGHCSNFEDDTHKDFFRRYPTAWESFRSHSKLLQADRYKSLFRLDPKDYKSWAHGLAAAGYATDPRYGEKLIRIIEGLDLQRLDG